MLRGQVYIVKTRGSRTLPETRNVSFNLEKGTLWSTISKAADKSRRTINTGWPWPIDQGCFGTSCPTWKWTHHVSFDKIFNKTPDYIFDNIVDNIWKENSSFLCLVCFELFIVIFWFCRGNAIFSLNFMDIEHFIMNIQPGADVCVCVYLCVLAMWNKALA